jgi:hypothetical protein
VRLSSGDEIWLAPRESGDALVPDYTQGAVLVFEELSTYWQGRRDVSGIAVAEKTVAEPKVDDGLPKTQRTESVRYDDDDERDPADAIGFSLLVEGRPKAVVHRFEDLPVHRAPDATWSGLSIGRDDEGLDMAVGLHTPIADVSRRHGRIMRVGNAVVFEDHSTNGTRVVREPDSGNPTIYSVHNRSIELHHNDVICLPDAPVADVRIRFRFVYEHAAVVEYNV